MLMTTFDIFDHFFNEDEQNQIEIIIEELTKRDYNSDHLWELDKTIGGIGAYCLPINPTVCYFQGTEVRNLYRSYQYARTNIDLADVNMFARDVIRDCGLSLEYLLKLVVYRKSKIDRLKVDFGIEVPLGVLIKRIEHKKWLSNDSIEELKMMLQNYNNSKHSIKLEGRERTFLAEDAIIYYLASRKIGVKVLKTLDTELTCGLANLSFDIIYKKGDYMEINKITIDRNILRMKETTNM